MQLSASAPRETPITPPSDTSTAPAARAALSSLDSLGEEVLRLARTVTTLRTALAARRRDGVEAAAFQLLGHLVREGAQRASALAEAVGVDPSTASRQVAQLVDRGLVERRPDPTDGRACLLAATEAGLATARTLRERRREAFALALRGWDDDDLRRLAELLARFTDDVTDHRAEVLAALAGPSTSEDA